LIEEHSMLSSIHEGNDRAVARMNLFRQALAAGEASLDDIPTLKQAHPYRGIVPIRAGGHEFVMFHAHDDVVVWEYLWRGDDGYESEMVRQWCDWCRAAEGEIWDIGAYSGLMSILAAMSHVRNSVHLFEPLDRVIERANINVKLNALQSRIARHAVACSEAEGTAEIILYRDENFLGTGSSIESKGNLKQFGTRTIRTVALDSYLPNASPKVVKVDVEGHEFATLKGMRRILERSRPHMLVEIWAQKRSEVVGLLRDMGYRLERVEDKDRGVNNYFATPIS
jgi:FkbM family methyltransferase